uniref:uncharacterized protein LOC124016533 n=2 Tax=Oncorhynchus gorbuscha TaxID=8017 RepID=UPI001EAF8519|nr:uncharacterized protein LOC124016533 [Oncorhynchus gorbuscha]
MRKTIRDVMSCKHPILYFTVIATISSVLTPCYGQIPDASISMPNAKIHPTIVRSGRLVVGNKLVQLRRVGFEVTNDESAASDRIKTQNGSLAFEAGNRAGQPASQEWHKLDAKLQHMGPSVQCSNETMTLRVKGGRAPHFLVDGGDGSPVLPLSRMPTHCGFSVKRSRRDVFFVAPYQGCHVTQEGGNYVLPLRLWGAPMTMSCPVAPPPPPSVSCYLSGMVVKLSMAANALQVKVSGVWEPLLAITQQCGLTIEPFFGGVVITAPYTGPCVALEASLKLNLLRLDTLCSTSGPSTISLRIPPNHPRPQQQPLPCLNKHIPLNLLARPCICHVKETPRSHKSSTTTPKQTNQALHMPPKGYPQVPLSYQFPQYNFPGFFPQRSVPRAPPGIASQLDNQNNPQKYHYSDSSYRQKSATPSVTASTIPGTTPQAQPKQPFMQYDQYPMVRSWNPYASALFPPHYGTAPYHSQGPRE